MCCHDVVILLCRGCSSFWMCVKLRYFDFLRSSLKIKEEIWVMPHTWVQFSHAASDAFLSSRYKTGHCLSTWVLVFFFFVISLFKSVFNHILLSLHSDPCKSQNIWAYLCLHVVVVLSGCEIWSICLLRTGVPPLFHGKVSLHPDLCRAFAVFWFPDGLLLSCSYLLPFFTLFWIHCIAGRLKVVQCGFLFKVNMNHRFYNILLCLFQSSKWLNYCSVRARGSVTGAAVTALLLYFFFFLD